MVWSRLDILYMFLTVNKCHEKTKSNNVFSTFLPWLSVPSPLVPKDVILKKKVRNRPTYVHLRTTKECHNKKDSQL